MAIGRIKHSGLQRLWRHGDDRRVPPDCVARLGDILTGLAIAASETDLADLPGIHPLRGNRADEWAVRVNRLQRVTFRFEDRDFQWSDMWCGPISRAGKKGWTRWVHLWHTSGDGRRTDAVALAAQRPAASGRARPPPRVAPLEDPMNFIPKELNPDQRCSLRDFLERVPDPRHRRGQRYPWAVLLTIVLAARLAGSTTLTEISDFGRALAVVFQLISAGFFTFACAGRAL